MACSKRQTGHSPFRELSCACALATRLFSQICIFLAQDARPTKLARYKQHNSRKDKTQTCAAVLKAFSDTRFSVPKMLNLRLRCSRFCHCVLSQTVIIYGDFLDWLRNYQLLKKDSARRSQEFSRPVDVWQKLQTSHFAFDRRTITDINCNSCLYVLSACCNCILFCFSYSSHFYPCLHLVSYSFITICPMLQLSLIPVRLLSSTVLDTLLSPLYTVDSLVPFLNPLALGVHQQ